MLLAANQYPLAPRHIAVFALGVALGAEATCVDTCANGFLARVHHSGLLLALVEDNAVVLLLIQLGEKLDLELRGGGYYVVVESGVMLPGLQGVSKSVRSCHIEQGPRDPGFETSTIIRSVVQFCATADTCGPWTQSLRGCSSVVERMIAIIFLCCFGLRIWAPKQATGAPGRRWACSAGRPLLCAVALEAAAAAAAAAACASISV